MKPVTQTPARFEKLIQRLAECIGSVAPDGIVRDAFVKVVRDEAGFCSLEPTTAAASMACALIDDPGTTSMASSRNDQELYDGWARLHDLDDAGRLREAFVTWRVQALERICELVWAQRELQSTLVRKRTDWLELSVELCLRSRGQTSMTAMNESHRLEKEEEDLVEKLTEVRAMENFLRACCDSVPGVPVGVVQIDDPARAAFLQRQLLWAQYHSDGLSWLESTTMLWTKCPQSHLKPHTLDRGCYIPSLPIECALDVVVYEIDCKLGIPADDNRSISDEDVGLLFDWHDLRRHLGRLEAGCRVLKWLKTASSSRRVRAWRTRANARRVVLLDVISRCELQLLSVPTQKGSAASQQPPDAADVQQRKSKAGVLLKLRMARSLEKFYRAQCVKITTDFA